MFRSHNFRFIKLTLCGCCHVTLMCDFIIFFSPAQTMLWECTSFSCTRYLGQCTQGTLSQRTADNGAFSQTDSTPACILSARGWHAASQLSSLNKAAWWSLQTVKTPPLCQFSSIVLAHKNTLKTIPNPPLPFPHQKNLKFTLFVLFCFVFFLFFSSLFFFFRASNDHNPPWRKPIVPWTFAESATPLYQTFVLITKSNKQRSPSTLACCQTLAFKPRTGSTIIPRQLLCTSFPPWPSSDPHLPAPPLSTVTVQGGGPNSPPRDSFVHFSISATLSSPVTAYPLKIKIFSRLLASYELITTRQLAG